MAWHSMVKNPTRHILGHSGEGGVTVASARIVAAVSTEAYSTAQPYSVHSVAWSLLITVTCVCVLFEWLCVRIF